MKTTVIARESVSFPTYDVKCRYNLIYEWTFDFLMATIYSPIVLLMSLPRVLRKAFDNAKKCSIVWVGSNASLQVIWLHKA
jgi:hypothetical protein